MDRRRLPEPEVSRPWKDFVENSSRCTVDQTESPLSALLDGDGKRADERTPKETHLRTGFLSQASGSAYCEMGKIKVAVAVHGPRESTRKESFRDQCRLHCEFQFATFARAERGDFQRDALEKEWSTILVEALGPAIRLDLYPKSHIDLVVMVLEADGTASSICAGILGASLALADAGIEMLDLVVASNLSFYDTSKQDAPAFLVDATTAEESQQQGWMLSASMPSLQENTHIVQQGKTEVGLWTKFLEQCTEQGHAYHSAMTQYLAESITAKDKKSKNKRKRDKQ